MDLTFDQTFEKGMGLISNSKLFLFFNLLIIFELYKILYFLKNESYLKIGIKNNLSIYMNS